MRSMSSRNGTEPGGNPGRIPRLGHGLSAGDRHSSGGWSPGAGSLLTSLAPGRSLKRLTASRAGRIPPECPSLTPGGPLVNQFAGPGTPHVAVPAAARSRARVDHRADIRSSAELGD